jgi:hypothetical protein
MNKRIKELAERAWIADCIEQSPEYKKNEMTKYLLQDMEGFHKKFAELIIKEYEQLLPEHCPWAKAEEKGPMQGWHVAFVARKHFGVE